MHEQSPVDRRQFLGGAAGTAALAAAPGKAAAAAAPKARDWSSASAVEVARAIRAGEVSSMALIKALLERIKSQRKSVNAVVILAENALARAEAADKAAARGEWWGPFHGVPFTVKDALETAGVRTVCGTKTLEKYIPRRDAAVVERLKAAGAILLGKSNVPEWAGDAQTYNDVFGTTNNPYDAKRTAGGSSGGSAAALAAGQSYMEVGSDLSGSIRWPAHCCGVYGHKPTLNLVPPRGHLTPKRGERLPPLDIATVGPLARSAADLLAMMKVLGGPDHDEAIAYRWSMPPARGTRLKDYRLGYVLEPHDKAVSKEVSPPLTQEVGQVLEGVIAALSKAGVTLRRGWPRGMKPSEHFATFMFLRTSMSAEAMQDKEEEALRKRAAKKDESDDWWEARVWTAPHKHWRAATEARLAARAVWQEYFRTHDAFLLPVFFTTATPHDHGPDEKRVIVTPEGKWNANTSFRFWSTFAGVAGLPATVAPVGKTKSGLPVGIQIIGPYLEDATSIDVAGKLADVVGGFVAPKGL